MILDILNRFNTKQSVEDLLYSIKDVITTGLSPPLPSRVA